MWVYDSKNSGPRNDPEACNVDFLKETNYVDQNHESNTKHSKSKNPPPGWMDAYPEWRRYRSQYPDGFNNSNGMTWNEPNPCNKYMIYEKRTDINQVIRRVYAEPLFFIGRWFGENYERNRKDRSLILEEKIYFKGNGLYFTCYIYLTIVIRCWQSVLFLEYNMWLTRKIFIQLIGNKTTYF